MARAVHRAADLKDALQEFLQYKLSPCYLTVYWDTLTSIKLDKF